jgi:hypothetical protein
LKTQTLQTEHSKASKTQRCRPSLPSERGRWHFSLHYSQRNHGIDSGVGACRRECGNHRHCN